MNNFFPRLANAAGPIFGVGNLTIDTGDVVAPQTVVWPATQAIGVLNNDGAGNLTWNPDATGSPAGSDTQIQFNNSGSFGASSNLTWDGTTLAVVGNASITGTRIFADLSSNSATRTLLQSSVTNGASLVTTLPNGTSTAAGFYAFNNSTTANASFAGLSALAAETNFTSGRNGTGTYLPFRTIVGNVTGLTNDILGNIVVGGDAALATTATDRFLYLNSMAGTPTGVPTASPLGANGAMAGKTPITVDTTNGLLYYNIAGTWNPAGAINSTPASATATGVKGTVAYDANYIYVCIATDTWVRADVASW